jgi:FkbM family methyltransferase
MSLEEYPNGGHFKWLRPWVEGRKLRTVIDCGAHVGMWSRYWYDRVERIEAFEPNPDIIPKFKEEMKGIKNITLHEYALGSNSGTVAMQYGKHPGTYHIKPNLYEHDGDIKIRTLDSFNFTKVDIIKIDVEGYEVPLLEGARETILANKPIIQIEANETGIRYGRPKIEISNTLRSLGMVRVAKQWPDQIWCF